MVQLTWLFPAAYMVFALIRGAITDFYPYPCADVGVLGYPRVIVNGVWIAALFIGMAAGLNAFDRWLVRREPTA